MSSIRAHGGFFRYRIVIWHADLMASIQQLVVRMDGWPGAPGFMTFYGTVDDAFRGDVSDFIDAVTNGCPSVISYTVPSEGVIIDDVTGEIETSWSQGTPTVFTGGTAGNFSSASGAVFNWLTNTFVNGRRLRGRTFLVPLSASTYDTDGTIGGASLTPLRSAAAALVDGGLLRCWHRPVAGAGGRSEVVVSSSVPDRVAILTSRRA